MTIEAMKVELTKQLLKVDDEDLLEEVQWLLQRSSKLDSALGASIKIGLQQAENSEGTPHEVVKEVYKKWF